MRFEELYCATRLREGKVVRSTKGGVRDLRFESSDCRLSDGGILLSAVGCLLSAGESQTVRLSDFRLAWYLEMYLPTYGWSHGEGRFLDSASLRSK